MFRCAASVSRVAAIVASRHLSRLAVQRVAQPATSHVLTVQKQNTQMRNFSAKAPLTKKTVEDRIILVLSCYDKVDPKKLTMDSDFSKDLGLDSLDQVEVVMAMEEEFGFEIPDGDADRFKTPRDILQYVCDKEDVYE